MSTSGVAVNPDVQSTFMKLSEGKKEFRYIIFKIEEREVVVESAVSQEELAIAGDDYEDCSKEAFEKFVADLKAKTDGFNDCRYAVFDFKFTCSRVGAGASKMDKIVFIQLCPDGAPMKKKMTYASSASAIKQSLGTGKILPFQHVKRADPSEISLFSSTPSKNAATGAANQAKSSPSKDVQEKSGPANELAPPAETVSVKRKRGRPRIHPRIDPGQAATLVKRPRGRPRKYSTVNEEEIEVETVVEEQEQLRGGDDVVFRQSDFLSKYKSAFVINNGEADTEACWDVPVCECVDQAVMEMECGEIRLRTSTTLTTSSKTCSNIWRKRDSWTSVSDISHMRRFHSFQVSSELIQLNVAQTVQCSSMGSYP